MGLDLSQVLIIDTIADFCDFLDALQESGEVHSLDFETLGLDCTQDLVRLMQVSGPVVSKLNVGGFGVETVIVDFFKVGAFAEWADDIAEACPWAVFNNGFEGRFLDNFCKKPNNRADLRDVGLMSKAKLGGRPLSLAQQVHRDLDIELDKTEQNSDWSQPVLTKSQLEYAANDAYYQYQLYVKWRDILKEDGLEQGFWTLNDAWRGTAAMEDTGMTLDVGYHKGLIRMWEQRRKAAEHCLRKFTPVETIPNLRSKKQISDFLQTIFDSKTIAGWPKTDKTGQLQTDRNILRQASYRAPYPLSRWLAALMVFNRADKYLGTYGDKLVNIMELSGSIKARFNIAQAITGRYSSSEPNLQNIPRNPLVRRSFIAPPGCIMVLADYSGIELRVLAELSDDEQLRQDVIYGNVHAENAALIFGYSREEFFKGLKGESAPKFKEMRAKAKAFSFQLTYGAGVGALALALRTTDEAASQHVDMWAARYPRAYGLRTKMFEQMGHTGFLPAGARTVYVPRDGRTMPVASNYPIQGAAADVMYRAVYHMDEFFYENRDRLMQPSRLLASIHDELLSITRPAYAEFVHAAQRRAMEQAWLDVFPGSSVDNLIESAIGQNWSVKP